MDEYGKKFDSKNLIFFHDPNIKSGYTSFKFDLTKEYIKQFSISSFLPDFNKFVHESIKDKVKISPTLRAIGTQDKYLRDRDSLGASVHLETLYVPHCCPGIYIASDLYFKTNKSFVRDASEINYSQSTAQMIRDLKKN